MAELVPLAARRRPLEVDVAPLAERWIEGLTALEDDDGRWPVHLRQHEDGVRWSLVALLDERPVGYASLLWTGRDTDGPEITDVSVAIGCRNGGVGTVLLAELESWALEAHHSRLAARVPLASPAALQLLARRGFVPARAGVSFDGLPLAPGMEVVVDARLTLLMEKALLLESAGAIDCGSSDAAVSVRYSSIRALDPGV